MAKPDSPKKLEKRLLRRMGWLNREYNLIRPGDRVLIGVSGGKDSLALALLLKKMQERAPFTFELDTVTLNQGIAKGELDALGSWLAAQGITWRALETNIAETCSRVVPEGKSPCSACARFRRGILYDLAYEERALLALGHHADDAVETLLMNIFFTGKLQAMPPVLLSDDKRNRLIRPMLYLRESDIALYSKLHDAPIVSPCSCPGAAWMASSQRQKMKALVAQMEERYPETCRHLLSATGNIKPSNLMDTSFFPFTELVTAWEQEPGRSKHWKEGVHKSSRQCGSREPGEDA